VKIKVGKKILIQIKRITVTEIFDFESLYADLDDDELLGNHEDLAKIKTTSKKVVYRLNIERNYSVAPEQLTTATSLLSH
jgi:hypothetical protein